MPQLCTKHFVYVTSEPLKQTEPQSRKRYYGCETVSVWGMRITTKPAVSVSEHLSHLNILKKQCDTFLWELLWILGGLI